MIALEFAPCRSAGVQRTLRFSEYLAKFGWQPYVVTASENIYDRRDETQRISVDVAKNITRAQCVDAGKKYAIKGRYFQWMTLPDRYWPWYFDAVKQASKLIENERPAVIWSTYPVLTAHLIARKLQQKYNIPWVADFRDPLQCRYDNSAQSYAWLKKWFEKRIIKNASKVIFTSERAANFYRDLYAEQPADKFITIENGFYTADISSERDCSSDNNSTNSSKFKLLYSGSLYANGRSPTSLFNALAVLKEKHLINRENFVLTFRPGNKESFSKILTTLNIDDLVEFLPSFSFAEAVAEMKNSSATVLIQDKIFHRQIPGKIYDYIYAGKPILALTPKDSATGDLIKKISFGFTADNEQEIVSTLQYLIENKIDCGEDVSQYSRQHKTEQLAQTFNSLIG